MCPSRASTAALVLTLSASIARISVAHYSATCGSDDVAGEVQGETGLVCSPRCSPVTYECSLDVPSGTQAQPQCFLQDVDRNFYCGMLCQVDAQCPSGAACKKVGTQMIGACIHPLSFSDWARQGTRTKLSVAFPTTAPGQSSKGFQIAKAFSALQSLKRRYSISDGDANVLIVKEMLSTVSASSNLGASDRQALASFEHMVHKALRSPGGGGDGSVANAWKSDMTLFENNMQKGLPGLEREAESVAWNIEHIENRNAASGLLRGLLEAAAIYLVCGCVYKHQALGARGQDMIPHIDFWLEYPAMVVDGIKYAQMMAQELVGKSGGGQGSFGGGFSSEGSAGSFQPIGASSNDRDTFAHFEPSK